MSETEPPVDRHVSSSAYTFNLVPYPRMMHLRGAPLRLPPSMYFHLPADGAAEFRSRAQILTQQFQRAGVRMNVQLHPQLQRGQALIGLSPTINPQSFQDDRHRALIAHQEGYRMTVNAEGAMIQAREQQGFLWGGLTLAQLMEAGGQINAMNVEDFPSMRVRAVYWDMRGWPPSRAYYEQVIETLGRFKFNHLLVNYEAHFNYHSQPGLGTPEAFTQQTLIELDEFASTRGITLVPALSCLSDLGFLLRQDTYRELREDPRYWQQLCPSHPASLDIFTAMIEDLIAAHRSEYVHIGGELAPFVGHCPACAARAQKLGGAQGLLLEYLGKVSRYLTARGKKVLLWDDQLRSMGEEQIRWLPENVIPICRIRQGMHKHPSTEALQFLERYKQLGRQIWGATHTLPSERYASLDNLDAWAQTNDLGYVDGLVGIVQGREYSTGPQQRPLDLAWPELLYMSERCWTGAKVSSRANFVPRVGACLFGLNEHKYQDRLWRGYELLLRDYPREAKELFQSAYHHCAHNMPLLALADAWCCLRSFQQYVLRFEETIGADFGKLRSGEADPFELGKLRWRIEDLKKQLVKIAEHFRRQAERMTVQASIEEYLGNQFAYYQRRLEELARLADGYPTPDATWQRPVKL